MCRIGTAQTKILLILSYDAVFAVLGLIYFTLVSADLDKFNKNFSLYLVCEANGLGKECDRSSFTQFSYIGGGLGTTVYWLLGLIPTVNLTFVISWKEAKKSLKHLWKTFFHLIFNKHILTASNSGIMDSQKAYHEDCV